MFYWSPNQHGIIIECQLHCDITVTAAAIAKARGRHSDYGHLSNIVQAPHTTACAEIETNIDFKLSSLCCVDLWEHNPEYFKILSIIIFVLGHFKFLVMWLAQHITILLTNSIIIYNMSILLLLNISDDQLVLGCKS